MIHPKYYREWQDKAPDALIIRVGPSKGIVVTWPHSDGTGVMTSTDVDAEAKVETVLRSAVGLKPGDVIRVRYNSTSSTLPLAGPRVIPVLKEGQTVPAFLRRAGDGSYEPAARGASFEPLIQLK